MVDEHLAAIVATSRADEAIEALQDAAVYDRSRRIEAVDDDQLAIPVSTAQPLACVNRFESGLATTRRLRTLEDHLSHRGWSEAELEDAPNSYARIGDIVVVNEQLTHRPTSVGEALLSLHRDATTVVSIDSIDGQRRRPSIDHIAGERTTRTVHRAHGIEYELDLAEVMFSPGNQHERQRMAACVDPDERVVDLCAGIGYFALSMADAGAFVTAVERVPDTYRWLVRNTTRNGLDDAITPVCGDCRALSVEADRAVIGHLPVHDCRDDPTRHGGGYLDVALRAVSAGWLHVHGVAWADEHAGAAEALGDRIERRGATVLDCEVRRVKGIAPRTDHLVIDAKIASRRGQ